MPIGQLIQIAGALLNMSAFALLHFELASPSAFRYLVPNFLGSVVLSTSAFVDRQWGFLLLELAWGVVAAHAMLGRLRERESTSRAA